MGIGPVEIIIILVMCIPVIIVIAIGVALLTRRGDLFSKRLPCPYCAERIKPEARVCPFCKRDLPLDWSKSNG